MSVTVDTPKHFHPNITVDSSFFSSKIDHQFHGFFALILIIKIWYSVLVSYDAAWLGNYSALIFKGRNNQEDVSTSQHLKVRVICCLETSRSDYLWRSIMSHKKGILSYTAAKTWKFWQKFVCRFYSLQNNWGLRLTPRPHQGSSRLEVRQLIVLQSALWLPCLRCLISLGINSTRF